MIRRDLWSVLPVVPYREIDEAIAYINAGPRPLAIYFFGPAGKDRRKVLERTTSGSVCINDTLLHYAQDDLQFGGVGASGMGAYHGLEGFKRLSHAKGVFEQSRWNMTGSPAAAVRPADECRNVVSAAMTAKSPVCAPP